MLARARCLLLLPLLAGTVMMADASAQARKETQKPKEIQKDTAKTSPAVFEVYKDKGGDFRFRLKSSDTILAIAAKGYDTKDACMKVVAQIKTEAARATVVEPPADDKAKK